MTAAIIITVCGLLLLAYIFDLTSSRTKIPAVILLFVLGWAAKQIGDFLELPIPDLTDLLPIFGTIGLVLIVLEGSLELELNKSKIPLIGKTMLGALVPIFGLSFLLAFTFQQFGDFSFKDSLTNAIPLCIISSAIAIPSVKNFSRRNKEFVTYESSLSDIFGVIFFNFVALNATIELKSFGIFGLQILLIIIVSFIATVGLAFLLSKIGHHVKFAPIVILVIVIYEVSKMYHLPALVFILLFGVFIGNLDELKTIGWIKKLKPEELNKEVSKFKEIVIMGSFLIRSIFFMLFGYLMDLAEVLNSATILWALGITAGIFFLRIVQLYISRLPVRPLAFIAPRGLITILLFLAISPSQMIPLVNRSLIVQVIILTALVMMIGLWTSNDKEESVLAPAGLPKDDFPLDFPG